ISLQTIGKVLRNPLYAGRVKLSEWDISTAGDFEPLVPEQVFDAIQARLRGPAPAVHLREHPDFPLRGFVQCECGKPFTGAWSRGKAGTLYGYYWCRECQPRVRVSKRDLEGAFVELLARLQPKPEYMRLFKAVVLDVWSKRTAVARDERERLQQRVATARAKLERIAGLLADG